MKHYSDQKSSKKNSLIGNLLLLLIILTGTAGTISTLRGNADGNSRAGQETEVVKSALPSRIDDSDGYEASTKGAESKKQTGEKHLIITGKRAADQQLTFQVKSFNSNGTYYIDFGDGTSQEVHEKSCYHSYTQAGKYSLRLKVKYHGVTKTIHRETIRIKDNYRIAKK